MTDAFGDDEPEDAWHPEDDVEEQLRQLRRRVHLLDFLGERGDVDDLTDRLTDWLEDEGDEATGREHLRYVHAREDLEFVRERL